MLELKKIFFFWKFGVIIFLYLKIILESTNIFEFWQRKNICLIILTLWPVLFLIKPEVLSDKPEVRTNKCGKRGRSSAVFYLTSREGYSVLVRICKFLIFANFLTPSPPRDCHTRAFFCNRFANPITDTFLCDKIFREKLVKNLEKIEESFDFFFQKLQFLSKIMIID